MSVIIGADQILSHIHQRAVRTMISTDVEDCLLSRVLSWIGPWRRYAPQPFKVVLQCP